MEITKFQKDLLVTLSAILFGSYLLYEALSRRALDDQYSKEGETVFGEVTSSYGVSAGRGGLTTYMVEYVFELPNEQTLTGSSPAYPPHPGRQKKIGEDIQVQYLASDPTKNRAFGIKEVKPRSFKMLVAVGLVTIGLCLYSFSFVLIKARRNRS